MTGTPVETALPFVPANSTSTKNLGFLDRFGDGSSLAPMHAALDTTGARIDPATSERQDAAAALLSQILGAVQAARTETVWTDDSGAFYVRVDKGGTLTWLTPSGATSSGPGAGARPAAGASVVVDRSPYQATAAGTGFALNDFLDHFVTADPASGAVISSFWLNATQGTVLASAPSSASITPAAALPSGAALDTSVQAVKVALGFPFQAGASIGNTSFGISGTLPAFAATPTFKVDQTAPGTTNKVSIGTDGTVTLGTGANVVGGVTEADGANATIGAKANPAASDNTSAWSLVALFKAMLNRAVTYTESSVALAANGAFTGALRNSNAGPGVQWVYAYFIAQVFADQAGTLFVENSPDGGNTWYPLNSTAGTAVAAGASVSVKVPAAINVNRVRYVNGATVQGKFFLTSMFSSS